MRIYGEKSIQIGVMWPGFFSGQFHADTPYELKCTENRSACMVSPAAPRWLPGLRGGCACNIQWVRADKGKVGGLAQPAWPFEIQSWLYIWQLCMLPLAVVILNSWL